MKEQVESAVRDHDWRRLSEWLARDPSLAFWKDRLGQSLLAHAARDKHANFLVEQLLLAGMSPDAPDQSGLAPLGAAIDGLHSHDESALENVRSLIRAGARLDQPVANGHPPLHWAVNEGKLAFIEVFLESGADPLQIGPYNENAFEIARSNGNPRVIEILQRFQERRSS